VVALGRWTSALIKNFVLHFSRRLAVPQGSCVGLYTFLLFVFGQEFFAFLAILFSLFHALLLLFGSHFFLKGSQSFTGLLFGHLQILARKDVSNCSGQGVHIDVVTASLQIVT